MAVRRSVCFGAAAVSCVAFSGHSLVFADGFESLKTPPPLYDVCVVGGGIVGLATARELKSRHPALAVAVFEKETELATHQTGRNSGVIHCGIYYPTGSLKAQLCVEGHRLTYEYCAARGIPVKQVGKLIVAVEEEEVPRLHGLYQRGVDNGVQGLKMLTADEITAMEPNVRGLAAVHCPTTGIVDWGLVAKHYAEDFVTAGGEVFTGHEVKAFEPLPHRADFADGVQLKVEDVTGKATAVQCKHVISCGGLHADKLARMSGGEADPQIIPVRGEYLLLKPHKAGFVKANVYPVPNPNVPFLGVHATPRMNGDIWFGPNAVLAFAREGYSYSVFSFTELWEALSFPGLRKLIVKYFKFGATEMYRSLFMEAQVKQLQRYFPTLTVDDLERGPAGVRAQAMDLEGTLVGDFVYGEDDNGRFLHVRNAPSPAATSSLAIAKMIADRAESRFDTLALQPTKSEKRE